MGKVLRHVKITLTQKNGISYMMREMKYGYGKILIIIQRIDKRDKNGIQKSVFFIYKKTKEET